MTNVTGDQHLVPQQERQPLIDTDIGNAIEICLAVAQLERNPPPRYAAYIADIASDLACDLGIALNVARDTNSDVRSRYNSKEELGNKITTRFWERVHAKEFDAFWNSIHEAVSVIRQSVNAAPVDGVSVADAHEKGIDQMTDLIEGERWRIQQREEDADEVEDEEGNMDDTDEEIDGVEENDTEEESDRAGEDEDVASSSMKLELAA